MASDTGAVAATGTLTADEAALAVLEALEPGGTPALVTANAAFAQLVDTPLPALVGRDFADLMREHMPRAQIERLIAALAAAEPTVIALPRPLSQGEQAAPALLHINPLPGRHMNESLFVVSEESDLHLSAPAPDGPPTLGWTLREARLKRAIEREEFALAYQPIADANSLAIVGVEALLRWPQEDGVMVSPTDIIPVAEASGLIVPLGQLVLRMACAQIAAWRRQGLRDLPVSVNLSARQLADAALPAKLFHLLDANGVPPECLALELTETVLLHGTPTVRRSLEALHAAGIRIALDDFGTGYASLGYLRQFPIDAIKIDRELVRPLGHDPAAAAIVEAAIRMAHAMKMSVVAEGVETRDQLMMLKAYRCDLVQGYLLSPPIAADAVAPLLAA